MPMRIAAASLFAAALVTAGASSAYAQAGPTAEGTIGYVYMYDDQISVGFPVGWAASVAGNATSWLALVGEVSGSYKKYTAAGSELQLRIHTFTAGPRLTVPASVPIAPFAQMLFGIVHGAVDLGAPGISLVVSGTNFAVQTGLGVDLNFSPRRAIRVEVDRRDVNDDDRDKGQRRFAVSFVFRN
jgi:hypothetical protein